MQLQIYQIGMRPHVSLQMQKFSELATQAVNYSQSLLWYEPGAL